MLFGNRPHFRTRRIYRTGGLFSLPCHYLKPPEGGGAGDPPADPPVEKIDKSEAVKAFAARDRAKAEVRLFAEILGLESDDFEVVENTDPETKKEKPYLVKGDRVEEARTLLAEARKAKREGNKGKWEDRERELASEHAKKIARLKQSQTKQVAALESYITDIAVVGQIRAALRDENAIDDLGDGTYSDVVALLLPKVKRSIDYVGGEDDETPQRVRVKVTPLKDDGEEWTDKEGEPEKIRTLVKAFLDKRPKYRSSRFRPGPGVGGNQQTRQKATAGANGDAVGPENAADRLFGRRS